MGSVLLPALTGTFNSIAIRCGGCSTNPVQQAILMLLASQMQPSGASVTFNMAHTWTGDSLLKSSA